MIGIASLEVTKKTLTTLSRITITRADRNRKR